jgi:selenocysteine lyase/cysteine desulfurase
MIAEGRVFPGQVEYNALPWKYAAGTPNILGAIISAQALRILLDLALTPDRPPARRQLTASGPLRPGVTGPGAGA